MAENVPVATRSILDSPVFSRIRRNHGLEHATLHSLAQVFPRQNFAGYSDVFGFWIVGDVGTELLTVTVLEALKRLRGGERSLAIHPNCGTNFLTAGTLAGLAGAAAMVGSGRRWQTKLQRLPFAVALATLASIFAQPLGMLIQARVTTSGEPGSLEVVEVNRKEQGSLVIHRVRTKG